jgi:uncharacterized phiE125 gp8 family phage protein
MLAPVRTVAPAETPISLAEAKAHLGVTDSSRDAMITALIQAATDCLDGWSGILGRALVTQTWRVDMRSWPGCRFLRLPLTPVQSVSVAYSDTANVDQVFASGNYSLHSDGVGPFVLLGDSVSWPSVYSRADAIRVTFVAGYGAAAAVPAPIKQALLLMVGSLYSAIGRDPSIRSETEDGVGSTTYGTEGVATFMRGAPEALLASYRVQRL